MTLSRSCSTTTASSDSTSTGVHDAHLVYLSIKLALAHLGVSVAHELVRKQALVVSSSVSTMVFAAFSFMNSSTKHFTKLSSYPWTHVTANSTGRHTRDGHGTDTTHARDAMANTTESGEREEKKSIEDARGD